MVIASQLERRLYGHLGWLCHPWVNAVGRRLWKTLRPIAPSRYRDYFPIVGEYTTRLPSGRQMKLVSPGLDWYAALLHWGGVEKHEPGTVRVLDSLALDARVVMDIGANIGVMGLFLALDHPNLRVFSFEPVPHVFAMLLRHRDLNAARNLSPQQLALSDIQGRLPLFIPKELWDTARVASLAQGYRQDGESVEVDVSTVDNFTAAQGLDRVDLMKIDVETHEPAVIRGAGQVIEKSRPYMVCEALPGHTDNGLDEAMKGRNYRYFLIEDQVLVEKARPGEDSTAAAWNFLFVPEERFEKALSLLERRLSVHTL